MSFLAEIHPFLTVVDPEVHRPTVGYPQTLRCSPPYSYPRGSVYWGFSRPGLTVLEAIQTDDRVLLDYDGWFYVFFLSQADSPDFAGGANKPGLCSSRGHAELMCWIFHKVV